MIIGVLQFAPKSGDTEQNIKDADAVLEEAMPRKLDVLVLPELAFSGCDFHSVEHISPFLELASDGITSAWAKVIALKYNCVVIVGYPERGKSKNHNSSIIINGDSEMIANYQNWTLGPREATWASKGGGIFYKKIGGLGKVIIGSPQSNPHNEVFSEFAFETLVSDSDLVVPSISWCATSTSMTCGQVLDRDETLRRWIDPLQHLTRERQDEIFFVFANRAGVEGNTMCAGTSAIVGIQGGVARIYEALGHNENGLLVVDTDNCKAKTTWDYNYRGKQSPRDTGTAIERPEDPKLRNSDLERKPDLVPSGLNGYDVFEALPRSMPMQRRKSI